MIIQDKVSWDSTLADWLQLMKALGVDCVSVDIPDGPRPGSPIDLSTAQSAAAFFARARNTVEEHGLELRTVLATSGFDAIKRGLPERERQIEWLLNAVHGMGAAGIPILAYNFKLLNSKLLRSAPTSGRGGASYISFDYAEYLKRPAAPIDPPLAEDEMWNNLRYFLQATIPAAEKAGVRLALHPDDPPVPHGTPALAGAAHIVSTLDQYQRIFALVPSVANGMLFCQGCVTEMQGVNVYDAIRQIGALDKIVMVHFRNVRGEFPRFQETFVDEGDVDMFRAMQTYRDAGFKGPFSLDHSPMFTHSEIANQAFVVGYLRALIQAVYR
jgi:mannonate dehydratase